MKVDKSMYCRHYILKQQLSPQFFYFSLAKFEASATTEPQQDMYISNFVFWNVMDCYFCCFYEKNRSMIYFQTFNIVLLVLGIILHLNCVYEKQSLIHESKNNSNFRSQTDSRQNHILNFPIHHNRITYQT